MKAKIRFHRLADRELTETANYLDRESPGLGSAFLDAVEACVSEIAEYPESGSIVLGKVRRRLVRKFPYSVLYSIRSDHVRILAVMHSRRRPTYWIERTDR